MSDGVLLDRAVQMLVEATPPVGAPIEDWRSGFEAMCATFELPSDALVEEVTLGGVPCRRVAAPGASSNGVVLHFHSGGYVMGSSYAYREFAYRLSAACGVPVVVPDYRLAPEHVFPEGASQDGPATYRALLDQYDARRVVVSGDSCGGGLAVSTLLTLRSAGDPLPAGVFLISPLLDFAAEGGSATTNDGIDPLISKAMVVEMGKVYIGDIDPHEHPTASPLWGTHESLPPMYLTAGSTEVVRDDAARLAASVVGSGGEAILELAEGMVHIWTLFPFLPEATATMTRIGAFVRSCID